MSQAIERYKLGEESPYKNQFLEAIRVPAGSQVLMLSGITPPVVNSSVPDDTVEAYGDTATQTRGILLELKATLERRGFALTDVVKMQAFLVADPRTGPRADFQAFSKAYLEFFGDRDGQTIPVRTRTQVVGLVWPGWLVEIDVTAAKAR